MNEPDAPGPSPIVVAIGKRNAAYLVFLGVCLVFTALGMLLTGGGDASGRGMGAVFGIFLYAGVSIPFFLWNLITLFVALAKGQPARHALIGILLPFLSMILGGFVLEILWRALVR